MAELQQWKRLLQTQCIFKTFNTRALKHPDIASWRRVWPRWAGGYGCSISYRAAAFLCGVSSFPWRGTYSTTLRAKMDHPCAYLIWLACYPTLVHTTHLTSCNCTDKMTTNQVSKLIGSVFQELPNICYEVQVFPMMCSYQNLTGMAVQPGNARTLFFPTRLDILNPASSEILNTLHSASI